MTILLPSVLHEIVARSPAAPNLEDASTLFRKAWPYFLGCLILASVLPHSRLALFVRLAVVVSGVMTGLGLVLWRLMGEQVARRNELTLTAYRRAFERYCQQSAPRLSQALRDMGTQDFAGRHNPKTPVGKNEHVLDKALRRVGMLFCPDVPHPIQPCIVPQYELRELRWERNYVADFAYLDSGHGLKIDIEIDEAYHRTAKQAGKDSKRNETFLGRGWVVLRFLEAEVLEKPDWCAMIVERTAQSLASGDPRGLVWVMASAAGQPLPELVPRLVRPEA